ncbi:hypothetical protein C1708_29690 [Streptomyces sp. DH-12]|uniref:hypothetical protein n=1 Tax=Streptomyces sp. DH-12 TaxID=2072509 RepID=UPI000CCE985E|nr:hypothetical protein [Streptomyces sp. DH-12]PNV35974.1 hypothetical protein C1708_29690 [Streptomyces sp. DH-12]
MIIQRPGTPSGGPVRPGKGIRLLGGHGIPPLPREAGSGPRARTLADHTVLKNGAAFPPAPASATRHGEGAASDYT